MSRHDWYRNTKWNAEIEADFENRLRRARDKSQYLRIQALFLAENYPEVSLRLLDRFFLFGNNYDTVLALDTKAQALIALGDIVGALATHEAALERERQFPSCLTDAYLDFSALILREGMESMFARALEVIDTHRDRPVFPVQKYRAYGIRALLLHHFGQKQEARANAKLAIAYALETQSGFSHHQKIGLVKVTDDWFGTSVAALAS